MKLREILITLICSGILLVGCVNEVKYSTYAKTEDVLYVGVIGAYIDNDTYKSIYEPIVKKCAKAIYGSEDRYVIIKTNSATQLYKLGTSDIDISLLLVPKTDTLKSSYALSDAYFKDGMVIISTSADMKLSDINGKHVGILNDASQTTIFNKAVSDAKLNVDTQLFASYPDMIDALSKGNISAIIGPKLQLSAYIGQGQYASEPFAEIEYCIAASTGNSKWIDAINKQLK